jgi:hypothetical protein
VVVEGTQRPEVADLGRTNESFLLLDGFLSNEKFIFV